MQFKPKLSREDIEANFVNYFVTALKHFDWLLYQASEKEELTPKEKRKVVVQEMKKRLGQWKNHKIIEKLSVSVLPTNQIEVLYKMPSPSINDIARQLRKSLTSLGMEEKEGKLFEIGILEDYEDGITYYDYFGCDGQCTAIVSEKDSANFVDWWIVVKNEKRSRRKLSAYVTMISRIY